MFFDVTPNSNYVISSLNRVVFVSKDGLVLKKFGPNNILKSMYQPGIVIDNKTMEIVGLHNDKSYMLSFYRYPIK